MPAPEGRGLGIVDPWLTSDVRKGQYFLLWVYPRTVTSLRHVWEHPGVPDEAEKLTPRMDSEKWLRAWASNAGVDYEEFMGAVSRQRGGPVLDYESGYDEPIPQELWAHAERVLGRKLVPAERYGCCA